MERHEKNPAADHQITNLAGRMRTEGVPPGRDLWPAIDRAITATENVHFAPPGPAAGRERLRPLVVAAALALLLVSGGVMVQQFGAQDGAVREPVRLVERDSGLDANNGLAVIDRALDELNAALAADPENQNLSQLTLMMHQKRGNLLRRDFASRNL